MAFTSAPVGLDALRRLAADRTVALFPEVAWVRVVLARERGRALAAVVELASGRFFYVYADPFTFGAGEAATVAEAFALMPRPGRALFPELVP